MKPSGILVEDTLGIETYVYLKLDKPMKASALMLYSGLVPDRNGAKLTPFDFKDFDVHYIDTNGTHKLSEDYKCALQEELNHRRAHCLFVFPKIDLKFFDVRNKADFAARYEIKKLLGL